jgi:hypothetical protein
MSEDSMRQYLYHEHHGECAYCRYRDVPPPEYPCCFCVVMIRVLEDYWEPREGER